MAKCNSCSAPLLANINRCRYCNVRNDVDLQGKYLFTIADKNSARICPHCETAMETIQFKLAEVFYIERCNSCFGLFFDPGEIETLLTSSVSNVFDINFTLINNINKDRFQRTRKVKYIKCPICRILMNRVNYAHRSGVIIDHCKKHGVWLDSGEITHLMEWKKAGGELLQAKQKKQSNKKNQRSKAKTNYHSSASLYQSKSLETKLLDSVSSLVFKLFKS